MTMVYSCVLCWKLLQQFNMKSYHNFILFSKIFCLPLALMSKFQLTKRYHAQVVSVQGLSAEGSGYESHWAHD